MIVSYVILGSLSAVIKVLYQSGADGELYRAQMSSGNVLGNGTNRNHGSALLRVKLKLMNYYEILKTKNHITFTFGHHAKVKNKWLLEVTN